MTVDSTTRGGCSGADRLCATLAAVLGVDSGLLGDDASPSRIPSWDSLNHLNIVLALESEFGISFSVDEALEMRSVAAIRRTLRARGIAV